MRAPRYVRRTMAATAIAGLALATATSTASAEPDPANVRPAAEQTVIGDCEPDGTVETGAIFNNPHTDATRIPDHIVCLIEGAPPGSKIKVATYNFADESVTDALWDAIVREVEVDIIVDGGVPQNPDASDDYMRIRALIDDPAHDYDASITPCGSGSDHGCIGRRIMHNKLFTFSETHGASNVTFLTSSNLEDANVNDGHNSGVGQWNSGYTAANDQGLYDWFASNYFEDLAAGRNDEYFEDNELPKPIGNYRVYHSPRGSGETVLEILDEVECHGNSSVGTDPGHRTIVRVSMWAITGTDTPDDPTTDPGLRIAERLWDLDNEGCYVDIVAKDLEYDSEADSDVLRTLLRMPERTADKNYHGPEVREFHNPEHYGLHEKNLMIEGKYENIPDRKVVFTGTLNFTQSSAGYVDDPDAENGVNDETWLQINDAGVHDRFQENFVDIRNAAHTCWQTSKDDACGGGRGDYSNGEPEQNCHETADDYEDANFLYLYGDIYCRGGNDAKDDSTWDKDYGDGEEQITDFDNRADSLVNTTDKHIKFYNYVNFNDGRGPMERDSFCVRPGQWVNQLSRYGDNHGSWSNSTSSHRQVSDTGDCDRWFGGYHEPYDE